MLFIHTKHLAITKYEIVISLQNINNLTYLHCLFYCLLILIIQKKIIQKIFYPKEITKGNHNAEHNFIAF